MGKFHIYAQVLPETHCFQENFTQLENFDTAAGHDGRDKFQVCVLLVLSSCRRDYSLVIFHCNLNFVSFYLLCFTS